MISIKISGDLKKLQGLEKQLRFAAASTVSKLAYKAQTEIVRRGGALDDEFVIRGKWFTPGYRYGINVKRATKNDLEANLYTRANWLLTAEGHAAGVKVPLPTHTNLTIPDVQETRGGITKKVRRTEKAKYLLANAEKTRAFKITTKAGLTLILQRKGGRGGRGGRTSRIVTKYVFTESAQVPRQSAVVDPTHQTVQRELARTWDEQLKVAMTTAK